MHIILYTDFSDAIVFAMPLPRLLLPDGGCYHVVSRIVERRFYFGVAEKEFFVMQLRRLEAFLDVRVLTFCVMSNHFHLLLEVPASDELLELDSEVLRQRLPLLYHGKALAEARDEIDRAEQHAASPTGTSSWLDEILARYQARMGDLSTFMKELKWRFSMWYNATNQRLGTLWEDRFKSVLVEGDEHVLLTVAAYIELNPVRAGVIADPKDYRWCGYGEAVAGKKLARERLARMHARMRACHALGRSRVTWSEVAARYRMHLFGKGERRLGDGRTGRGAKSGFDAATVGEVADVQKGILPLHQALRCRVRYFTDGAVFGGEEFVEQVFQQHRERFGAKRKTGARRMRGADWGKLVTMRELREAIGGIVGKRNGE